jgi:hypothetical protein
VLKELWGLKGLKVHQDLHQLLVRRQRQLFMVVENFVVIQLKGLVELFGNRPPEVVAGMDIDIEQKRIV